MKKQLVILVIILVICSLLGSVSITGATKSNLRKNNIDDDKVLSENGFTEKSLKNLDGEVKSKLATTLVNNPDMVDLSTTTSSINEIEMIKDFVNLTDNELIEKYNITTENIKETKKIIDLLNKKTDEDLKIEYQMSDTEIEVLRNALKKDTRKTYFSNNKFSITETESPINTYFRAASGINNLTFSMWVFNDSGTSGKPVYYSVNSDFTWSKKPLISTAIFKDKIAFAWGGDLTTDFVTYQKFSYVQSKGAEQKKNPSVKEKPVDAGLTYTFVQGIDTSTSNFYYRLDYGFVAFGIYQTRKVKKDTKIIAEYGHQTVSITGGGLDINGTPMISFGTGYESSNQLKKIIKY